MTALSDYEKLESVGLWRPDPEAQRRDVVVSFGEATLVLTDTAGRALTHWSLPAISRLNPGQRPALFTPDPDALETIEIEDDTLIDAIETMRKRLIARRRRPGRVRLWLGLSVGALVLGLAVIWLPRALTEQVIRTVPASTRGEIDARLEQQMTHLTGTTCHSVRADRALRRLNERIGGRAPVRVLPGELPAPIALPGGMVLLDRAMVEIPDDPAVTAGHILSARLIADETDPLRALLHRAGPGAMLELLTSGTLSDARLANEAEALIKAPVQRPNDAAILERFGAAQVPLRPWARDIDITGETTAALIAAAPTESVPPIMGDGDWIALQAICEN